MANGTAYIDRFNEEFDTPEKRLAAARQIADPSAETLPDEAHPSHNILAALWGETGPSRNKFAEAMYELQASIETRPHHTIAVFRLGSRAVVNRSIQRAEVCGPDHRFPLERVCLDVGQLVKDQTTKRGMFTYSYWASGPGSQKPAGRVPAPWLRFGVGVRATNRQRFTIDVDGSTTVSELDDEHRAEGTIPVMGGVVPLGVSQREYQSTRLMTALETVIGNSTSMALVGQLAIIHGPDAQQHFQQLKLRNTSVPDLTQIFGTSSSCAA